MNENPEKPATPRPSMLQLEEFRKKVDKDILKDMKMSPEEFAKFLKDYEELARRQPKDATEKAESIARRKRAELYRTSPAGPRRRTRAERTTASATMANRRLLRVIASLTRISSAD